MLADLSEWESIFQKKFGELDQRRKLRAGSVLKVIPEKEEWIWFCDLVKKEWKKWQEHLLSFPACLVVLYDGIAFFEYDEKTFWPKFSEITQSSLAISAKQKKDLNECFSKASASLGLFVEKSIKGTLYVGSAVYHIGIPLSLWDDFLDLCEWAIWKEDWETISDEEWRVCATRISGSRSRLKKFLLDNREIANSFIKEILDTKTILREDKSLNINSISKATFLRSEFFESVPETLDFVQPSFVSNLTLKPELFFEIEKRTLSIHLPPIPRNELPGEWKIHNLSQSGATTPDSFPINSIAISSVIPLRFESRNTTLNFNVPGIEEWGIFDCDDGGRLVSRTREYLPLRPYALLSTNPLVEICRKGFSEDFPINEEFLLKDNYKCYLTRLWPTKPHSSVVVNSKNLNKRYLLKSHAQIILQMLIGRKARAASFERIGRMLKVEYLPLFSMSIPEDFFEQPDNFLNSKFNVKIDGNKAPGKWERLKSSYQEGKLFYYWNWDHRPQQVKKGTIYDLREISGFFKLPKFYGNHALTIEGPGLSANHNIYIASPRQKIEASWRNLPGDFLIWFLLSQSEIGFSWEELLNIKEIISPDGFVSYEVIKNFHELGYFCRNGKRWAIAQSKAVLSQKIEEISNNKSSKSYLICQVDYCGDPSILWGLYRKLLWVTENLPTIEVNRNLGLPHLRMKWMANLKPSIQEYLRFRKVKIGTSLWSL